MKKFIAILLTVVLSLSCIPFSVGAVPNSVSFYFGDMNTDWVVTIEDVTDVQQYLAEMVKWIYDYRLRADYNHDDEVSVKDVTEMQRAIAEFPQPNGCGGYFWSDTSLVQEAQPDYLSGTMPVGTPVTFTVRSSQAERYVFCVDDAVVQPISASNTCTYTFTEPGYHRVGVFAFIDTGSRVRGVFYIDYLVLDSVSDTEVRINKFHIDQRWNQPSYFVQYEATGGTGPYTYELVISELRENDIEHFNAYLATHETDWQLRYNDRLDRYEFYREFSAESEIDIDKAMFAYDQTYHLTVQAKDAQGVLSSSKFGYLRCNSQSG